MTDREFERLVRRHADALYGFLMYRTGDADLSEDVMADTLERAYRSRARYDRRRASEITWLCTIALNRLRDVMRRRTAEAQAVERLAHGPQHDDPRDRLAERDAVATALTVLSDEERETIALVYGADLTAAQAANALGVPVTTVQGRVYRALGKMRTAMG